MYIHTTRTPLHRIVLIKVPNQQPNNTHQTVDKVHVRVYVHVHVQTFLLICIELVFMVNFILINNFID